MKIFGVIVTILFFLRSISDAQSIVKGTIRDAKTIEPLVGATIYVSELKTGTATDTTGSFVLKNLKAGRLLLEITSIGYQTKVLDILVKRDTNLQIILTASSAELHEVIVTGVSRATELKHSPAIIKTADRNAIVQTTATNLIDALKNIPGISQISTGAAISKPVIRGMGHNRVITLYNGIRQEGQQWGDDHGIEIDEFDIDRVEIVKGPGSMMYGSDGIAGVLHFLSPKALQVGETNTQFTSNYQSNNMLISNSISYAGNKRGLQWRFRGSNKLAANFRNPFDGAVYNSGFSEYNGSAFLGINRNWGHSHLNLSTFNSRINLPEGERDDSGRFTFTNSLGQQQTTTLKDLRGYRIGYPNQLIGHNRLSSTTSISLPGGFLLIDLAVQRNKRQEFASLQQKDKAELFFDLNTFNYNIRYNLEEKRGWTFSLGIGGMQQRNENRGADFLIPEHQLFDAGAFVFFRKKLHEVLHFSAAIRADTRGLRARELYLSPKGLPVQIPDSTDVLKFAALNQKFSGFSGCAGLAWQINNKSTIKLNLSRGFRAPSVPELASNGRHEGTFRYEIGNPNLKPESSHQFDIGYFLNSEYFVFECTPFINFVSGYIFMQKLTDKNGAVISPDPSNPIPGFRYTEGMAGLYGGEVFSDIQPHPVDWLHIENSLSFVHATRFNQPDSSRYLPFIPAPKYSAILRAQINNIGKRFHNIYLRVGLDHFFAQNRIYSAFGTETITGAYTLLGAGMGASIGAPGKTDAVKIILNAENLADKGYQNHLNRLRYAPLNLATGRTGIFNMGLNISLKIIVNL